MLKILLIIVISFSFITDGNTRGSRSGGNVSVRGYTKSNGTYVAPHMRSAPDGNFNNNWSTLGNVNPYTGKEGTKTVPTESGTLNNFKLSPQIYSPEQTEKDNKLDATDNPTENETQPILKPSSLEPTPSSKQEKNDLLPPNAKIDYTGHNWECKSGYIQKGNSCLAIQIPLNAKLTIRVIIGSVKMDLSKVVKTAT